MIAGRLRCWAVANLFDMPQWLCYTPPTSQGSPVRCGGRDSASAQADSRQRLRSILIECGNRGGHTAIQLSASLARTVLTVPLC